MLTYPIYDGEKIVGTVQGRQEGMYYLLKCTCNSLTGGPQRIGLVHENAGRMDLGQCIPEGKELTLVKRIRKKDVDGQTVKFVILRKTAKDDIKLEEGMAFPMLDKLPNAKVLGDNKDLRLVLADQSSVSPTGQ